MKRPILGGFKAAFLFAALGAALSGCGGGAPDADAPHAQAAATSKAMAAREAAPAALFEPSLDARPGAAATAGWQALTLQGLVLENGKAQAQRRVSALLGDRTLASAMTDAQGRYSLVLGLDRGGAGIVRLRVGEDAAHPRSRMEVLLGGPATLAALGGPTSVLGADVLSALRIDELSTVESARLINYHRHGTQTDLTDETALKAALQGFSLDDLGDLAALAQLFLRRELPAPAGVTTLWQLITDEAQLRDFRTAARANKAERYDALRAEAREGFYRRAMFRAGTLPARLMLGTLAAYQQAPLFQQTKGGAELQLAGDGTGELRGGQSFQTGHERVQWLLNDKGGLELRGSGTQVGAGIGQADQPYSSHLVRLHRLSRTAYGDVLMAAFCSAAKPCSLDEAGENGLEELPRLGLRVAVAPAFDERSMPGRWFLPIAVRSTASTHYATGQLTAQPLQLLAGGRIVDSPLRWRVDQGDLLIEHGGIVPESWRLRGVQQTGAQQRIVQISYQGSNGTSVGLGEAYKRDESLALTRAALLGEWRIDRLSLSFELNADGGARLRTHFTGYDGRWQLLPGGVVAIDLQDDGGGRRIYWHAIAAEGKQLLLVETGHPAAAPERMSAPVAYRYAHAVTP